MADFARLDDDELLRLTREQPEAFGAFYERHVRAVLAHLRRRGRGETQAPDGLAELLDEALERGEELLDGVPQNYTNGLRDLPPAERKAVVARIVEERGRSRHGTSRASRSTPCGPSFVIIDERDVHMGDDGVQIDEMHLIDMGFPRIEVTYAGGRTEEIRGP